MRALTSLLALSIAGCTAVFMDLVPGTSHEADVLARFGQPESQRQLPDGSRLLEYPREPEGNENWRITLAADGTLLAVDQLIDEPHFAHILRGMTRSDVLLELGRPSEQKSYRNLGEDVVSWRYLEFGARRMFFNAHFDSAGRLKYASRSPDPAADSRGGRR